jgi:hypothetical protein
MRVSPALLLPVILLSSPPLYAEDVDRPSLQLLEFLGSEDDEAASLMPPDEQETATIGGPEKQNETSDEHEND